MTLTVPRPTAGARKARRLGLIALALAALGLAAALALSALRDTVVFFRSPAEVERLAIAPGTRFRLGGMVEAGSLVKAPGGRLSFAVTDGAARRLVAYEGTVPDLFREGQGVVAEGALEADGTFRAATVLAKHDETYMPREVADALKREGRWGPNGYVDPAAKSSAVTAPAVSGTAGAAAAWGARP